MPPAREDQVSLRMSPSACPEAFTQLVELSLDTRGLSECGCWLSPVGAGEPPALPQVPLSPGAPALVTPLRPVTVLRHPCPPRPSFHPIFPISQKHHPVSSGHQDMKPVCSPASLCAERLGTVPGALPVFALRAQRRLLVLPVPSVSWVSSRAALPLSRTPVPASTLGVPMARLPPRHWQRPLCLAGVSVTRFVLFRQGELCSSLGLASCGSCPSPVQGRPRYFLGIFVKRLRCCTHPQSLCKTPTSPFVCESAGF